MPLVLLFHGGGGSGEQLELRSSRMDEVADREGFLVVYPDGTGLIRTWNAGSCCGKAVRENTDDVGFVAALLDHLEQSLCLDRRRIYASGMSNGAMMVHRLACEMSSRIAAIAPVAGVDVTSTCTPPRPVPVMQIHGTQDGHVPWTGGEGCGLAGVAYPSVPASMEGWRTRDGCRATRAPYLEQGNGVCETFQGCDRGADVVLCRIDGGGHAWPGGEPRRQVTRCPADGSQSRTFSASEVLWKFFDSHPLVRSPAGPGPR
jgi:polyhydroxybutyrate depolymerase